MKESLRYVEQAIGMSHYYEGCQRQLNIVSNVVCSKQSFFPSSLGLA